MSANFVTYLAVLESLGVWRIESKKEQCIQQTEQKLDEGSSKCDFELDQLFLEASQQLQDVFPHPLDPASSSASPISTKQSLPKECFAPSKSVQVIEDIRKGNMVKKTREDMLYCVRKWNEWRECRKEPSDITKMTKTELDEALCRFVLEIRIKNGQLYLQILCTTSSMESCVIKSRRTARH